MEQFIGGDSANRVSMVSDALQLLTFTVGDEEYGVDIMAVNEIKGVTDITCLPSSPPFMKGVTNLRGHIIPIFDMRSRFSLPAGEGDEKNVVIILSILDKVVGIAVDTVSDILNSCGAAIKPPPAIQQMEKDVFVKGLISNEDRMIIVLDVEHLFDSVLLNAVVQAA